MNNFTSQLLATKKTVLKMLQLSEEEKNKVLLDLANELVKQSNIILEANAKDLENFETNNPLHDRMLLTPERIKNIANELTNVTKLKDPIGEVLEEKDMQTGIHIKKIKVPLGVVAVIYEARPNVTIDVFGLTFKSGNSCILKGSRSAINSNEALINIIQQVLESNGLPKEIICLLTLSREETGELLKANEYIDIVIPRGSQNLINAVREQATIPTIETGAGVVHTYFSESGDLKKGKAIITNEKLRRPSVCNALDTLIINKNRLSDLSEIMSDLPENNVEVFADQQSYDVLKNKYSSKLLKHVNDDSFGTEFLSYKMSIKTVSNLDEAIDHITKYSSKHSEAIISEDTTEIEKFLNLIDAAAVYANTSTAFTDGAQFGLGAEIGISTQKLHARGPMGLNELTSYKWIISSDGMTR